MIRHVVGCLEVNALHRITEQRREHSLAHVKESVDREGLILRVVESVELLHATKVVVVVVALKVVALKVAGDGRGSCFHKTHKTHKKDAQPKTVKRASTDVAAAEDGPPSKRLRSTRMP